MSNEFKDLFSKQSADYAKFRPTYPKKLFEHLSSLVKNHDSAWDCATGNGQAAIELTRYFNHVIATDPSEKQLANAVQNPKIEYRQESAEKTSLADHSIDLTTVATAFHWFKHEEFFKEIKRVMKPGGVVAVWSYSVARITPEVDVVVDRFYSGTLDGYWEKERRYVDQGYRGMLFPLEELKVPHIEMTADWTLDHFVGYLGTWSALQTYIKKNGTNPLEPLYEELKKVWGKTDARKISWELGIRVGRV